MCELDYQQAQTIGLSQTQYAELVSVFAQFPQVQSVIVYGSRAKGNYHSRSDLDLAVRLETPDRHTIAQLDLALDDSDLVPSVDLQDLSEITNPKLKDHIDRRGIELALVSQAEPER